MNVKKWVRTLALLIVWHYQCHRINIMLRFCGFLRDCQRFIFQIIPLPGTTIAGIFDRADDIKAAMQIPLFQPFRKGVHIFLAVSAVPVSKISLRKMLLSSAFRNSDKALSIALGCNLMGEMVIEDLEKMVHAMYVGATSSGKSVGLMCLILSLICKHPVNEVNLIIFDIGADTLDVLDGIPHLSYPIVKDRDEGIYVIQSLADEMERRYSIESSQRCNLPTIVCIMDEFNSFIGSIDNNRQEVVDNISNLLRRGRKAKIHLVPATQEPTNKKMAVEIGNITSRMAFRVDRFQTSVAILNHSGAEKLPGNGAMLYQSAEYPDSIYVQGAYISDGEVAQLVERIKGAEQDFSNKFVIPEFVAPDSPALLNAPVDAVRIDNEDEKELSDIILWTLERDEISALQIKKDFNMGNRVDKIVDKLCEFGLITEKFANKPRAVLPQSIEEVPEEVMSFLARCGVSVDDVAMALGKRNSDNVANQEGEFHV